MRQATGRGYEVRTEGDAFFLVFDSPVEALRCAVESQEALEEYAWPSGMRIQVRMGLHTGTPIVHEGEYYGPSAPEKAKASRRAFAGGVELGFRLRFQGILTAKPYVPRLLSLCKRFSSSISGGLHKILDMLRQMCYIFAKRSTRGWDDRYAGGAS